MSGSDTVHLSATGRKVACGLPDGRVRSSDYPHMVDCGRCRSTALFRGKAVPQREPASRHPFPIPDPRLQDLHQMMADECPGTLTIRSFKEDRMSLRHEIAGVRRNDFEVRSLNKIVREGYLPPLNLVRVSVKGLQDVDVSPVPSAVLAVALR